MEAGRIGTIPLLLKVSCLANSCCLSGRWSLLAIKSFFFSLPDAEMELLAHEPDFDFFRLQFLKSPSNSLELFQTLCQESACSQGKEVHKI